MKINGLELPLTLQTSLRNGSWIKRGIGYSGRWNNEKYIGLFKAHFPRIEKPLPEFFDYDCMVRENRLWTGPCEITAYYTGKPSNKHTPGNVNPNYTVIIGESEPDRPIALDYRTINPKVIYFCEIDYISIWIEAFENIDGMIKALEL